MISNIISAEPILDDARLVESVLNGDRDAFTELVRKYQNPIAAFAYSNCGDIAQSEDLAQDTFVVAWRKLRDLKEPSKFKSWLFGIARNLINNSARKQTRNPLAASSELDENLTSAAPAGNPTDHAITKEEQAILWRALEQIPEPYREPLVLFYREHQSIQRVADVLDLTEEATRQRLSRGRKLLHERVVAFVEGALKQTAPDQAFTAGVLAAIPQIATTTATLGAAKSAAGKTAASVGVKVLLVPFLWLLGALAATWASIFKLTSSKRERKVAAKSALVFWSYNIVWAAFWSVLQEYGDYEHHNKALTLTLVISMVPYAIGLGWMFRYNQRTQRRIRMEESGMATDPGLLGTGKPFEWRSRREFLGVPLVHVRFNADFKDKTAAKGWIAIGTRAYGLLFAGGAFAVAPISWGALAIGVVGLGGFGVGVLAFGGLSIGYAAVGGGAIGYMAFGGFTLAWLAASGGAPIAHHFAMGGGALAAHANDDVAREFFNHSFFFRYAGPFTLVMITVSWLPALATVWFKKRFGKDKLPS
ncbi:MAG: polymerase, sigma-24 subunit, subfamily [Verrucomicrobiales bacterium]|nr:polymerase, sigma-24 subunit, subfamily [Verrucomicrobiales bacterium]